VGVACAVAFVASGCVMVVELLAGRLIAPYVGNSLYTWTSIIGVVLGGLAAGNYVGGRLADRFRTRPTLAFLFALASAGCLLVALLNRWVGEWSVLWFLTWPQRIALHVVLVFAPAATTLGTIGPVVAKMALDEGRQVGRTVGDVYAWGAIGSIVGTFACGFYFLSVLGVYPILYIVVIVLAALAILFAARSWLPYAWGGTAVLSIGIAVCPWTWSRSVAEEVGLRDPQKAGVFFDSDSQYSHVRVVASQAEAGVREMMLDKLVHSRWNADHPESLLYSYERVYAAVTDHVAGPRKDINVLILGGGGFTHPRYLVRQRPQSHVQVVEIDPVVTQAAKEAFGLEDDPPFKIVHLDARQYLADLVRRKNSGEDIPAFDFVFLDAVNDYSVPYHLTTRECQGLISKLLTPDGVFLMTLIDVFEEGKFLGAILDTVQQTFTRTSCYCAGEIGSSFDPQARATFVVVASNRDLHLGDMAGSQYADEARQWLLPDQEIVALLKRTGDRVLTDDCAPVESLLAGVIQRAGKDAYLRFYNRGNQEYAAGKLEAAAASFRRAIDLQPSFHLAHLNLGDVLVDQNRLNEALGSFRAAASLRPDLAEPVHNIGSVFFRLHNYEAAGEAFRKAIAIKPDYANAYNSLGMALANQGQLEEARAEFQTALQVDPRHRSAAENLARLEAALQGQPSTKRP
jgi:tetratricopeptide (TPR) repeat protein